MSHDKREKRLTVAVAGQVTSNGADMDAVKDKKKNGAQTKENPAGKHLKTDTDIVFDIKPEHVYIVTGIAFAAENAARDKKGRALCT